MTSRRALLLSLSLFVCGCAGGAAEAKLRAEFDPALARGDVTAAVEAWERVGVDDRVRLRQVAEVVLWQALGVPDARMRERAVRIAADLADPILERPLAARLSDEDARVRARVAAAFASQLDEAKQAAAQALDGADPVARALAVLALPALPDGRERLERLLADVDPGVRQAALAQLPALEPRSAAPRARAALHDPDAGVRAQALRTLAQLRAKDFAADVKMELADPALSVRLAALEALKRLSTAPEQLVLLAQAGDRFVALRAAVALVRHGRQSDALLAITAAAADRHEAVRAAAMNAAGELGPAAIPLISASLRDPDLEVRLAAARALAQLGQTEAARPVFAAALATPAGLDAADELARLGDERGRARLHAAAASADEATRERAVALLAPLPGSRPRLAHALADADLRVRLVAAEATLRQIFR